MEEGMSLNSKFSRGRVVIGLSVILAVSLMSSAAFAQSDSNPKWDLFVGYQWLHPGGTVPAPFTDFNNPVGLKVPDMSPGFGSALTYNFDRHWGAEFDLVTTGETAITRRPDPSGRVSSGAPITQIISCTVWSA